MIRKSVTLGMALAVGALASTCAIAQDTVKIGVVLPLTGGLAPVGKQVQAGIQLYIQQHGATVVGKTIDLIIKDDAGVPDNTKRLAQELIVNDKVGVIGSGHTPGAMAVGPLSTQSKTANVVMVSTTWPPALLNASLNTAVASAPGAQSDWTMTTFLLPFLAAHSPMIPDCWPSVKLVRTM